MSPLYLTPLWNLGIQPWRVLLGSYWGRPFPSSPGPLFQNEARCSAFDMQIIFHYHANKTHFHEKGCALSLILKVRVFGTQTWPIFPTRFPNQTLLCNFFLLKSIKPFNFYLSVKRIGPRIRKGNERRDRLSTLVQKVFLEISLRPRDGDNELHSSVSSSSWAVACSRLRDGGGKSFSKKKCEKRAGAGEGDSLPFFPPPPPPFPSRAHLIFALLVLICFHYTIWEPGTGKLGWWGLLIGDTN